MTWSTAIPVPLHAQASGAAPTYHCVFFRPSNDRGGERQVVAIQVPETGASEIKTMLNKKEHASRRIVFVCDTSQQAEHVAEFASAILKTHERIALERAQSGGWGILS